MRGFVPVDEHAGTVVFSAVWADQPGKSEGLSPAGRLEQRVGVLITPGSRPVEIPSRVLQPSHRNFDHIRSLLRGELPKPAHRTVIHQKAPCRRDQRIDAIWGPARAT